ncbi:HAD-like domain-containing protein, partial [Catenaria anguillulae PL171]
PILPLPCPPGSKPVLVLDMDETLIHARDDPHHPSAHSGDSHFVVRFPNPQSPLHAFSKHVYLRPFVHDFLEEMSRHYRIVVFTAGIRAYTEQVIRELDPRGNRITATLFRDSCQDLK